MLWLLRIGKSIGTGIGSVLLGIGVFDLVFAIYFRIRWPEFSRGDLFKYNLITALRSWGFTTTGLALLFLGGPAVLFISGFVGGIRRFQR